MPIPAKNKINIVFLRKWNSCKYCSFRFVLTDVLTGQNEKSSKWKEKEAFLCPFSTKLQCSTKIKIQSDQTNATELTFKKLPAPTLKLNYFHCLSEKGAKPLPGIGKSGRAASAPEPAFGQQILGHLLRGSRIWTIIPFPCSAFLKYL